MKNKYSFVLAICFLVNKNINIINISINIINIWGFKNK